MQPLATTVNQRFGSLAMTAWAPAFGAALECRRQLGIQPCEAELITAILMSYYTPGLWESIAQATLARRLGVSRPRVNHMVTALSKKGLLATSPDEARRRHPSWNAPLSYCLDPYLAVLAKWTARRSPKFNLCARLDAEADERLNDFVGNVRSGIWQWRLGDRLSGPDTIDVLVRDFTERYAFSGLGSVE
jgi:hypothetical protein